MTVNYKGEDTHKSFLGGLVTLTAVLFIFVFFVNGMRRMLDRDNPEQASFFLPVSRSVDDSLSIPELNGQMYIGLRQREEKEIPGSYDEKIIAFDNQYINGKIDYFDNEKLVGR